MFIHSTTPQQGLGGIVNNTHSSTHSSFSDPTTVHVFKKRKLDATIDSYAVGGKSNDSFSVVKNNDNFIVPTSNVQLDGYVTKIKDDKYSGRSYSTLKSNCIETYAGVINKNLDSYNNNIHKNHEKFNESHYKNSDIYSSTSLASNIDYLNTGSVRTSSSRRSNTKNGSNDERSPQHGAMPQTLVRASTIKLLDTYHRCGQKVKII